MPTRGYKHYNAAPEQTRYNLRLSANRRAGEYDLYVLRTSHFVRNNTTPFLGFGLVFGWGRVTKSALCRTKDVAPDESV